MEGSGTQPASALGVFATEIHPCFVQGCHWGSGLGVSIHTWATLASAQRDAAACPLCSSSSVGLPFVCGHYSPSAAISSTFIRYFMTIFKHWMCLELSPPFLGILPVFASRHSELAPTTFLFQITFSLSNRWQQHSSGYFCVRAGFLCMNTSINP